MKKTQKQLLCFFTFLTGVALILQSFLPGFIAISQLNADEETSSPEPTIETPQIIEETLAVQPSVSQEQESTPTIEPAASIAPDTTPLSTPEITSIPTPETTVTEEPKKYEEPPKETGPPSSTEALAKEDKEEGKILDGISIKINPTPTLTSTNTTTDTEKICEIPTTLQTTTAFDWSINEFEKTAETKNPVELGVTYVFPGNTNVSVTFSCLPKNPDKRTHLKIQEFDINELKLPDGINAKDKAYDITTGMNNTTFEYSVTLPKSDTTDAKVSYIEKSISEAKNSHLTASDIHLIEENKINQEEHSVTITALDHFTIFFVTTAVDTVSLWPDTLSNSEKNLVKYSDNNRYENNGLWPIALQWNTEYIQFEYDNTLPSNITVHSANIIFEYRRSNKYSIISPEYARIRIWDGSSWQLLPNNLWISNPSTDVSFTLPIPLAYIDTADKINNFMFQFKLVGAPKTYIDRAVLDVNYSFCGDGTINQTNEQCDDGNTVSNDGCSATCQMETGSISGYKWEDLNGDGVWQQNDEPTLDGVQFCINSNNSAYPNYCESDEPTVTTGQGIWTDGYYEFTHLLPGTYDVCETPIYPYSSWVQSYPTYFGCHTATVTAGQNTSNINFGNYKASSIGGWKWNDINGDGIWQTATESAVKIDNLRIRLWYGTIDAPLYETGNAFIYDNGYFEWDTISPGIYWLSEYNVPSGWTQTWPNAGAPIAPNGERVIGPIVVTSDSNHLTNNFGNRQAASIIAHKFISDNRDNIQDPKEANKEGWTMSLYSEFNCNGTPLKIKTTNADGDAIFTDLLFGSYSIKEEYRSGWENEANLCQNVSVDTNSVTVNFGNFEFGKIQGRKYEDTNGNGSKESDEPYIQNWNIRLYNKLSDGSWSTYYVEHTTNANGLYRFENLSPGTYYLCEVMQNGWTQTDPDPSEGINNRSVNKDKEGSRCKSAVIDESGDTIMGKSFGNQYKPPKLEISKENNALTDKNPGESVSYTITVKALDNTAYNVKVTDLLPDGFVYRPGSGQQDGAPATFEHEYASPGTWSLGNMTEGQETVLTFIADIASNQKPGIYKDLTLAYGCDAVEGCDISPNVIARAVTPGYIDEPNHVGTDVTVIKDLQDSKSMAVIKNETRDETEEERQRREGTVLGAQLPATGAHPISIVIASMFIVIGSICLVIGAKKLRRYHA